MRLIRQPMPEISGVSKLWWSSVHPVGQCGPKISCPKTQTLPNLRLPITSAYNEGRKELGLSFHCQHATTTFASQWRGCIEERKLFLTLYMMTDASHKSAYVRVRVRPTTRWITNAASVTHQTVNRLEYGMTLITTYCAEGNDFVINCCDTNEKGRKWEDGESG